jgi:hypothetical protein
MITRFKNFKTYVRRTFSILSSPAKSPRSRHIKSREINSSSSFVLVSPLFHLGNFLIMEHF